MARFPKLHPRAKLVERLRFVPEAVFVPLADTPADGDIFDFNAADRSCGLRVEHMKGDGFSQLVFQLTDIGEGDGGKLRDNALLPDTDIVEQLATTFDNSVSDSWLLKKLPRARCRILPFVPSSNVGSSSRT